MSKLKNHVLALKEVQEQIKTKHIEVQGMSQDFVTDFEEYFKVKPQEQITAYQAVELFVRLMEFENELDSKKLYPLKPPFHRLLSQNSDVECTIHMTSDLTLHEICKYNKTIVPQDMDDFTQSTIIIPQGG